MGRVGQGGQRADLQRIIQWTRSLLRSCTGRCMVCVAVHGTCALTLLHTHLPQQLVVLLLQSLGRGPGGQRAPERHLQLREEQHQVRLRVLRGQSPWHHPICPCGKLVPMSPHSPKASLMLF